MFLSNIFGIIRHHQVSCGLKKHLDDPVPYIDFPVLHCLGIRSSVSGIRSDQIRKYMSKIQPMANLQYLA